MTSVEVCGLLHGVCRSYMISVYLFRHRRFAKARGTAGGVFYLSLSRFEIRLFRYYPVANNARLSPVLVLQISLRGAMRDNTLLYPCSTAPYISPPLQSPAQHSDTSPNLSATARNPAFPSHRHASHNSTLPFHNADELYFSMTVHNSTFPQPCLAFAVLIITMPLHCLTQHHATPAQQCHTLLRPSVASPWEVLI